MTRGRDLDEVGTLYLLCISEPLHHAAHYLGWATAGTADDRVREHLDGSGSPLVRAAVGAGRTVRLVLTRAGTKREERALKARHNLRPLCPECRAEHNRRAAERMRRYRGRTTCPIP